MKTAIKLMCSVISLSWAGLAWSGETPAKGLVTVKSQHSVEDTVKRFTDILNKKSFTIFATVDHAKGAASAGHELAATQVVIFGNPKVGSPLMKCAPTVAIDLPQKMLVWENNAGEVWMAYNDPQYLAKRHDMKGCEPILEKVSNALAGLSAKAAGQ